MYKKRKKDLLFASALRGNDWTLLAGGVLASKGIYILFSFFQEKKISARDPVFDKLLDKGYV